MTTKSIDIQKTRRYAFAPCRCLVCGERKTLAEFRQYNFTSRHRRTQICSECRRTYDDVERQVEKGNPKLRLIKKSEIPKLTLRELDMLPRWAVLRHKEIFKFLAWLRERRIQRNKEVNWMADDLTKKILNLPNRIAAVISKTYEICGDDFTMDDYEAITRIRDMLEEIDPNIIEQNKKKRLSPTRKV